MGAQPRDRAPSGTEARSGVVGEPRTTLDSRHSTLDLRGKHVHMIGIGGCGMSGAAAMLLDMGAIVSGSDLSSFKGLGTLVERGARVVVGHHAAQLPETAELVVMSAAIPEDNPELVAARRRDLPIIKYAALLGILMDPQSGPTGHRAGMAIAGTHGKSTTTALCAYLLREGGLDPSYIFGADCRQLGGNSGVGQGPLLVVESCEYDRSFLHGRPQSGAILNIEADHLDCYKDFDDLVSAFGQFAARLRPAKRGRSAPCARSDGLLVCNAEDEWALLASRRAKVRVETFGLHADADWRAARLTCKQGRYSFDIEYRGRLLFSSSLAIAGEYNVANALAAIALAYDAGVEAPAIAEALGTFAGIERRMTCRVEGKTSRSGVTVVDDYAHHPTEVRVTLQAARDMYEPRRTIVVFQPHQYARTCLLMEEFGESFASADEVIISDIYAAREPGADAAGGARELVSRIRANGGTAHYRSTLAEAADHVIDCVAAGDLVMTMGAGDVWKVADDLVERI